MSKWRRCVADAGGSSSRAPSFSTKRQRFSILLRNQIFAGSVHEPERQWPAWRANADRFFVAARIRNLEPEITVPSILVDILFERIALVRWRSLLGLRFDVWWALALRLLRRGGCDRNLRGHNRSDYRHAVPELLFQRLMSTLHVRLAGHRAF